MYGYFSFYVCKKNILTSHKGATSLTSTYWKQGPGGGEGPRPHDRLADIVLITHAFSSEFVPPRHAPGHSLDLCEVDYATPMHIIEVYDNKVKFIS